MTIKVCACWNRCYKQYKQIYKCNTMHHINKFTMLHYRGSFTMWVVVLNISTALRWQTIFAQIIPAQENKNIGIVQQLIKQKDAKIYQSILYGARFKFKFTTESILLIYPHHLNLPAPAKSRKIKLVSKFSSAGKTKPHKPADVTFPKSPLCLDRMLPLFFTATSRVLLWSSTMETLNSNLQPHAF